MADRSLFEANLNALVAGDHSLATDVRYREEGTLIRPVACRVGGQVPSLITDKGQILLHSSYDPNREAQRQIDNLDNPGFVVFFGLGMGIHARCLLRDHPKCIVVTVEYNKPMLSELLGLFDYTDLFSCHRFKLLIDPPQGRISEEIRWFYRPSLMGGFAYQGLGPRLSLDNECFSAAKSELDKALSDISADLATQSRFGRIWFRNSLINLRCAPMSSPLPASPRRVAICAAGPSLEFRANELKTLSDAGWGILCTDTSLGFCLRRGFKPFLAISIDPQLISYRHFHYPFSAYTPLALDLASSPSLSRLSALPSFFNSGHPFHSYVSHNWIGLPSLDCSGGNVSYAALALARALGAEEVRFFGLDLCYPSGTSYVRGSYLYPYFDGRSQRLLPIETHFARMVHSGKGMVFKGNADRFAYESPQMERYRASLTALAQGLGMSGYQALGHGRGFELQSPDTLDFGAISLKAKSSSPDHRWLQTNPIRNGQNYTSFLARYHKDLSQTDLASFFTRARSFNGLGRYDEAALSLLPQLAAFEHTRRQAHEPFDPEEAMETTLAHALAMIGAELGRF